MKRVCRCYLLVFGLVALSTAWAQAEEKKAPAPVGKTVEAVKGPAPVMEVVEAAHDFGQVTQGKVLTHDFRVLNKGDAPLEIKAVKPG
jgi:hypothetical protein